MGRVAYAFAATILSASISRIRGLSILERV